MRLHLAIFAVALVLGLATRADANGRSKAPRAGSAGGKIPRKELAKIRRSVKRFVAEDPMYHAPDGHERVGRIKVLGVSPEGKSYRVFFDTTIEQEGSATEASRTADGLQLWVPRSGRKPTYVKLDTERSPAVRERAARKGRNPSGMLNGSQRKAAARRRLEGEPWSFLESRGLSSRGKSEIFETDRGDRVAVDLVTGKTRLYRGAAPPSKEPAFKLTFQPGP